MLRKALRFIKSNKKSKRRPKSPNKSVAWEKAGDVKIKLNKLLKLSSLPHKIENISSFRSHNSKAHAYARIWGLTKIWQMALNEKPHYIIEVISEKYDNLPDSRKDEVLLHELAHIPMNFSGSLLPHIRYGKRSFHKKVDNLIRSVRLSEKTR